MELGYCFQLNCLCVCVYTIRLCKVLCNCCVQRNAVKTSGCVNVRRYDLDVGGGFSTCPEALRRAVSRSAMRPRDVRRVPNWQSIYNLTEMIPHETERSKLVTEGRVNAAAMMSGPLQELLVFGSALAAHRIRIPWNNSGINLHTR